MPEGWIELVPPGRHADLRPLRPVRPPAPPRWRLAAALLVATFLTTTTLGAVWHRWSLVRLSTDLSPFLLPETVLGVWGDPALLSSGLTFAAAALGILFCHEMGHYLACRYYRLPATLPYFLPVPLAVGTFGAFIRIKAPIRTKRQLFDIGVAGPLAGFAVLIPVLVLGVALSRPAAVDLGPAGELTGRNILVPGDSLALELTTRAIHGVLPAGTLLEPHPLLLAAWFGLLATALNLLPLGQLDGGHILYAALGRTQRRLAFPLWLGMGALGLAWPGWWLWCVLVLFIGLAHPPVRDEAVPLDRRRRAVAWVTLVVFLLCFMPVPLELFPIL